MLSSLFFNAKLIVSFSCHIRRFLFALLYLGFMLNYIHLRIKNRMKKIKQRTYLISILNTDTRERVKWIYEFHFDQFLLKWLPKKWQNNNSNNINKQSDPRISFKTETVLLSINPIIFRINILTGSILSRHRIKYNRYTHFPQYACMYNVIYLFICCCCCCFFSLFYRQKHKLQIIIIIDEMFLKRLNNKLSHSSHTIDSCMHLKLKH